MLPGERLYYYLINIVEEDGKTVRHLLMTKKEFDALPRHETVTLCDALKPGHLHRFDGAYLSVIVRYDTELVTMTESLMQRAMARHAAAMGGN